MMARRNSRTYRSAAQARGRGMAARRELIGREEAPTEMEEVPMRRWPHSIPAPAAAPQAERDASAAMTQMLERLSCQNQLLVDLLGAVNSLTASVLCQRKS